MDFAATDQVCWRTQVHTLCAHVIPPKADEKRHARNNGTPHTSIPNNQKSSKTLSKTCIAISKERTQQINHVRPNSWTLCDRVSWREAVNVSLRFGVFVESGLESLLTSLMDEIAWFVSLHVRQFQKIQVGGRPPMQWTTSHDRSSLEDMYCSKSFFLNKNTMAVMRIYEDEWNVGDVIDSVINGGGSRQASRQIILVGSRLRRIQ